MKAKIDIQFPCGYKYNVEIDGTDFDVKKIQISDQKLMVCPLHGKNCPPNINIGKVAIKELFGEEED